MTSRLTAGGGFMRKGMPTFLSFGAKWRTIHPFHSKPIIQLRVTLTASPDTLLPPGEFIAFSGWMSSTLQQVGGGQYLH